MAEQRTYERIAVDPERLTPREDIAERVGRMVAYLDTLSEGELAALLADDSVDEAAE